MRDKLRYLFSSKKLLLAQLADLQSQLQQAWDENKKLSEDYEDVLNDYYSVRDQLHRVARERDECYRQRRLADTGNKEE